MDGHIALDAPPSLAALSDEGPIALFLDFDGTLVELADSPDGIIVPERLGENLCRIADQLEGRLALVSGRAIVDLDRHLGAHDLARAGSHGVDRLTAAGEALGEAAESLPEAAHRELREFAAEVGLDLESKTHGCALHFRRMPERGGEAIAFAAVVAERHGLAVKHGKSIVEIVQPGASKGKAVRAYMTTSLFAGARPIFVGDDITDEDGFMAAQALNGFGILVGNRTPTIAKYELAGTAQVHAWLGL